MELRAATPEDAPGIALVKLAAWVHAFQEIVDPRELDALDHDEETAEWRTRLAEPWSSIAHVVDQDGRLVAFSAWLAPRRSPDETVRDAHLTHLYVHPAAQGAGVGSTLLAAAEDALREVGGRTARLSLHRDNHWAAAFFGDRGWVVDAETPADVLPYEGWTRRL